MKDETRLRPMAVKIGQEFGRLFRDGRGTIGQICDAETERVSAFLDAARRPIIFGLLPHLQEGVGGDYRVFVLGPDGSDLLSFTPDLRRWHIVGKDAPGARAGVRSLMTYMGCGAPIHAGDLGRLLGVASARVLLDQK